jgi:outer membrane lipase/esterase
LHAAVFAAQGGLSFGEMMKFSGFFTTGAMRRLGLKFLGALVFVVGPLALISCGGGGSTKDPFVPTKAIGFGDSLSVVTPGSRYTVNASDGQIMTFVEQFLSSYDLKYTDTAVFTSYAVGNARVATTATFAASAKTLKNQVADYLATHSVGAQDMFILSGGLTDLIDEYQAYLTAGADATAETAMRANLQAAALAYYNVVKGLLDAGAKRVIVVPSFNLKYTPWGKSQSDGGAKLGDMTRLFNDALLARFDGTSGNLVVWAPYESAFDTIMLNPSSYGLTDVSTPICDTATFPPMDAANGIGLGNNQLNSSLCTDSMLIKVSSTTGTITATLSAYGFADMVHPTPVVNRNLGAAIYNSAYGR